MVRRRNARACRDVEEPVQTLFGLVAVAIVAACATAPDPVPSASPTAAAPTDPLAAVCADAGSSAPAQAGPGARTASVGRGLPEPIVLAQDGGSGAEAGSGSWRLCLADGTSISGPGLCHWTADRTGVLWMAGEDARGLDGLVSPFLSFEDEEEVLVIDRSDAGGIVAGYRPTEETSFEMSSTADRAAGLVAFERLRLHDPATGEPTPARWPGPEEPRLDGVMRWTCASAPPFSEGWGPGTVRLGLDEPQAQLTWQASCWWGLVQQADGSLAPIVTAVDGDFTAAGEQEISIHLTPLDDRHPFALTTAATREGETRSSTYTAGEDPPVFAERAPDGSSGQLRFTRWRRLQPTEGDPEEPLGGPGGPLAIDGVLEWRCDAPRGPLVEVEPTAPPP